MEEAAGNNKNKGSWLQHAMKYAVPLLVTVGLCWLMFRDFSFGSMMRIITTQCNFVWIIVPLAISVLSHIARAFRWGIQLQALGINARGSDLILSIFGTYAVNLVFPRLGEVWRTGFISQRQKAPFSAVFGSMVADRLADTVIVLLLLAVALLLAGKHIISYLSQNQALYYKMVAVASSPWLWLAVIACIAAAWWLLTRKSAAGSVLSRLQRFVAGLWQGFSVVVTMPGKGRWLFLTAVIWGCYFVQLYIAFFAFPFTAAVAESYGPTAVLVTFVMSSIAMGVPSNGGIGPWQWAVIFALSLYSVPQADAMAFANLVLGTQTLLLILLGIITFVAIMLEKKNKSLVTDKKITKK